MVVAFQLVGSAAAHSECTKIKNRSLSVRATACFFAKHASRGLTSEIFRSPTMAGGLLAAHREYFFEVGGYGENLLADLR